MNDDVRQLGKRAAARLAAVVAGALVCAAGQSCKVGPNYSRPELQFPATYKSARGAAEANQLGTNWWQLFDDPQLTALEEAATSYNPDLQAAMQRVLQA